MNKTIAYLMLAFIITSSFGLSACKDKNPPVQDNVEVNANGGDNPFDDNNPKTQNHGAENTDQVNQNNNQTQNTTTTTTPVKTPSTTQESDNSLKTETTNTGTNTSTQSAPPSTSPNQTISSIYKNGTYSESGSYNCPAGNQNIGVTFVIDKDIVSDVSISLDANNQTALYYQQQFAAGISSVVVGKKIDEIGAVGKINGASLTGAGFNEALALLKGVAKN